MSGTHTALDAAATDRKARLAKLASLKRKTPGSDTTIPPTEDNTVSTHDTDSTPQTDVYLSGRNYDVQNRAPKLGFEHAPNSDSDFETIESQAARLTAVAAEKAAKDEAEAERGIDLFKLQPKKLNWDLKRDLAEKMRVLDVRTQNAIAKLVRDRIEKQKQEAQKRAANSDAEGEEVGLDGSTLAEAVHVREQEEAEDERREKEMEDEDLV